MPTKERKQESGLEVQLPTNPEVAAQPYESKYYIGDEGSNHPLFDSATRLNEAGYYSMRDRGSNPPTQNQANQPGRQSQTMILGRSRAFWMLAVITIVCLVAALGAGLGAGLTAQHKPSSPNTPSSETHVTSTDAKTTPATTTDASNAPMTITELGNITTVTPTSTQLPSPICPAGDSSTYIATNRPLPAINSQYDWHIPNATLSFKILCHTHFVAPGNFITDLQIYTNVSSLSECLDRCALFDFNARPKNFPTLGCTGITWGSADILRQTEGTGGPWHTCWLQSNISLATPP